MLACLNGRFIPAGQPCIRAQDRGFRFGDGVFETIAVTRGLPYQWDFHVQRLQAGLAALSIGLEISGLFMDALELLARNEVSEGMLRIAVSRGAGSRGYLPLPECTPLVLMETLPLPSRPEEGVTLLFSEIEKISPRALPVSCKIAAVGLNSTLARMEAERAGCFDALQLNARGEICETSSANIFWLRDGTLYTPALSCGVLSGSTRHALMRLSPWPVIEGVFMPDTLRGAQAVMLTNAGLPVVAVNRLEPADWTWQSVATAQQIENLLQKDREEDAAALRKRIDCC